MRVNTWDIAHHLLKRFLGSPLPVVGRAGRAALAENRVWVRNKDDARQFSGLQVSKHVDHDGAKAGAGERSDTYVENAFVSTEK